MPAHLPDRRNLLVAQAALVSKLTEPVRRTPGRHVAVGHLHNQLSALRHLLVGDQRKRRSFPGAAGHAVGVEIRATASLKVGVGGARVGSLARCRDGSERVRIDTMAMVFIAVVLSWGAGDGGHGVGITEARRSRRSGGGDLRRTVGPRCRVGDMDPQIQVAGRRWATCLWDLLPPDAGTAGVRRVHHPSRSVDLRGLRASVMCSSPAASVPPPPPMKRMPWSRPRRPSPPAPGQRLPQVVRRDDAPRLAEIGVVVDPSAMPISPSSTTCLGRRGCLRAWQPTGLVDHRRNPRRYSPRCVRTAADSITRILVPANATDRDRTTADALNLRRVAVRHQAVAGEQQHVDARPRLEGRSTPVVSRIWSVAPWIGTIRALRTRHRVSTPTASLLCR